MSYLTYVARRLALAVLSVYLVVTAVVIAMYPILDEFVQSSIRAIRYRKITEMEKRRLIAALRRAYDADQSLPDRLLDWWLGVPTFEWGVSVVHGEPVIDVLAGPVVRTLAYAVLGLVLAMLAGVLVGVGVAIGRRAAIDWSARLTAYSLVGIPAFMVLSYAGLIAGTDIAVLGFDVSLPRPGRMVLGTLAVALSLLAGQVRFARAATLERSGLTFVTMLRAKGVGRVRLARHLLRNVAVPIVSLSIGELLGTLVITVYVVESVLAIRGLGAVTLTAAKQADLPLVVGSVLVVVYLGIAARLCRDLFAGYVDPRIRQE